MEVKQKQIREKVKREQFPHSHATGLMCWGFARLHALLIIILQFVVLASAQHVNPQMCVGKMDGMVYTDPTSCEGFFRCQSGGMMRQRCAPNLLFDLFLHYCVPEHVANCGSRPRGIIQIEAPPSQKTHHAVCSNVRDGTLIANPTSCRAFIECQGRLRLDGECPHNELFNARTLTCQPESSVNCGSRQILPSNIDVAISQACQGRRNQERVADPRSCAKYFECFYQRTIERYCNPGQLFDETVGFCKPSNTVRCGNRGSVIDLRSTDINRILPSDMCLSLPSGTRFSDPHDCQRFYECRNQQQFDLICLDAQLFDTTTHQCRPGQFVNCGSREGINLVKRSVCSGQRDGALFENPHNCRSYFECRSGQGNSRDCELGYLFEAQSSRCVEAYLVQCGARIIPSEDALDNIEDFFPHCPNQGTYFRGNPQDCSGYIICSEGRMIQQFCQPGLHFNPRKVICDLPRNVNCLAARVVIPQTPILPECSEGERYFPDLANCQQYYECVKNEPKLKQCPTGRMWDNVQERCEPMNPQLCRKTFSS